MANESIYTAFQRLWDNIVAALTEKSSATNIVNGSSEGSLRSVSATAENDTYTLGEHAFAEGYHTIAASQYQHVQGKFNAPDVDEKYIHIVGKGESDSDRSNAHTIDWNGDAWYAGDVYVGSTHNVNKDEGSVRLAMISEVPAVDKDLTVSDAAADAKSVGDKFKNIEDEVGLLQSKADASTVVNCVLLASAWAAEEGGTEDAPPFFQTIEVPTLGAAQNGIVSVQHGASAEQRLTAMDTMLSVFGQEEGKLTFVADGDRPNVDIPVTVILLG